MKMNSLGKKIGASVLAASLAFSLFPKLAGNDSVSAAGVKDGTNTCLGTSKIKEPTAPADKDAAWKGSYVYYGSYGGNPIKFRVLAKDSEAYGDSALFLDSDEVLFKDYFDNTSPYSNAWDGSNIQGVLNGTFLTGFTSLEQGAITTSKGNGGLSYTDPSFGKTIYVAPVSINDNVFLLDATEVMNPAYGYSADCGRTTPSDWTFANASDWSSHEVANHKKVGSSGFWWMRSSSVEDYFVPMAGNVSYNGHLNYYDVRVAIGVAPALNVDQSKILFSTLVSGEFNKDEAEYKLTLVDDDLTIAVQTGEEVTMTGTTITVPYQITGTDAANATRTSVLILDNEFAAGNANGASIVYYDELDGTFSTVSEGTFTLPSSLDLGGWGTDYFVYIVAEDINDTKATDYASKPVKLDAPVFQFKVNNGGGISNSLGTNDRARYADTVTLVANVPATGKVFDKWVVDSGSVTLADNESYITTFVMPAEDVEVTAAYKDLDAWTKTQSNTDLGTTQIASPYQPGSDEYNLPWIGSYVYFGAYENNPIRFRVLAPETDVYGGSTLFLDSDTRLFNGYFDNTTPYSNAWDGSDIQGVLNGSFLTGFTDAEQAAIATSTGNGGLSYADPSFGATVYGAPVSVNDKVFLLDATEVMNPAYGYSADCGWTTTSDWTWANSGDWNWHEVANREKGGESANYWWLRSAYSNYSIGAGIVLTYGYLRDAEVNYSISGVAPALNVDQNSILFSSVISGTSGMYGAEYKLTIFDEELKTGIQTGKDVSAEGAKITVPYTITGADSANATQVSVLILDKEFAAGNANGASILYYDKLGGTFGTTAEGIFTLPSSFDLSGWGTDYFVYIIAEDVNGTYETDYASKPVELSAPVFTVTVTNDGNGTATASASKGTTGTEITLTATPKTGYQFKEWQVISGGVTITNNKFTIGSSIVEVKAVFEKINYTVDVVSGTADKTTANMGDKVTITADAPAAGKEFDKWVVASGDATLVDPSASTTSFTMPAGNVKVAATYKDVVYNVKVTTDGNGTASASPVSGIMGKEVVLTATPNTGYQFKEWQVISGGVTITNNKFTIGTADVEVKAVFEKIPYSVTVVSGTADKTTATMGDTVKITAGAPAAGKEFDKWVVDAGDITLANVMSSTTTFTMPAGNVKVTATYKDIVYNVKVTTDGNGEASASYVEGTMGKEIELTASPNPGYKFKEWQVISGGVTITDNKFTIGTESVEIKAIFEKVPYTVTVVSGTADKTTATIGETVTITADAPAAGKVFDKWEVVSGAVTLADPSSATTTFAMPAEKVEIKAVYKDIICKVTFETNGGSAVAPQDVTYGNKATKPADPVKDGYTFAGWYQDATFAAAFDFNTAITADITIYAKWNIIPYYTVVEGANGTVTQGSDYKLTVKRNDADETTINHFTGVKIDDKVLTKDKDYTAEAGSVKITLKAETIKNLSVGGHTVTVLFDDGEAVTSLNVKAAPAVPSTGEMIAPILWIGLGCVAAAGALFAVVLVQKKRKEIQ